VIRALLWVMPLAAVASWGIAGSVRRYAIERAMLDVPNDRSSHTVATPRGGGIAIAAVTLLGVALGATMGWIPGRVAAALLGGGSLVAMVGWVDDRQGLSATVRAIAHVIAAGWALFSLHGLPALQIGGHVVSLGWIGSVLAAVGIVWMTNLYNFMDGIDGLAGGEAALVGGFAGTLLAAAGQPGLALIAWLVAASSAGFLVWNWAPARLFMGDVGSGFLGFIVAVLAVASENTRAVPLLTWVTLSSRAVVFRAPPPCVSTCSAGGHEPSSRHHHRARTGHRAVRPGLDGLAMAGLAAANVCRRRSGDASDLPHGRATSPDVCFVTFGHRGTFRLSIECTMTASRLEPSVPRAASEPAAGTRAHGGLEEGPDSDLSVIAAVNVLLRRRVLVIGVTTCVVVALLTMALLRPRTYTSTASFMPQANRNTPGSGGGIAAQLGLSMLSTDATQSPSFYVDLLKSRGILDSTVSTRFRVRTDSGVVAATLIDLLDAKGNTRALRQDDAVRRLSRLVQSEASPKTSVVTLSVRSKDPVLAKEVAERVLTLVSTFNLRRRKSQASEERRFAEQRLVEVGQELRIAEDRLQMFLQHNRAYENSPELRFAMDRLSREVAMRQQVYTSVAQAHEQARMDEVRDTPVLTVIEQPDVPARSDPRGLIKWTAIGLVLGLGLGVALAFLREMMSRANAESGTEIDQFNTLWRDTVQDLRRPWRPVARVLGKRQPSR
jgi:Fuc2NAc and GlcNAc transferase